MAKGLIAALIAKKAPSSEGVSGDDMDRKMAMGVKERAAKSLISAIQAGDASGVASAFKRMYDACASEGESDYAEE